MRELSLHVMDIAQNSIVAGATLIEVTVAELCHAEKLRITIADNGRGMDEATLGRVQSPFYTTRTTRDVGLGIPLYKMACEMTGGSLQIDSSLGKGTTLVAEFVTSHIDMMPLGSLSETMRLLITCNPALDFVYARTLDERSYTLDTREMREILGDDISFSNPEVSLWLAEYLAEQDQLLTSASTNF